MRIQATEAVKTYFDMAYLALEANRRQYGSPEMQDMRELRGVAIIDERVARLVIQTISCWIYSTHVMDHEWCGPDPQLALERYLSSFVTAGVNMRRGYKHGFCVLPEGTDRELWWEEPAEPIPLPTRPPPKLARHDLPNSLQELLRNDERRQEFVRLFRWLNRVTQAIEEATRPMPEQVMFRTIDKMLQMLFKSVQVIQGLVLAGYFVGARVFTLDSSSTPPTVITIPPEAWIKL